MEKGIKIIQNSFTAIVFEILNHFLIEDPSEDQTIKQFFFSIFGLGIAIFFSRRAHHEKLMESRFNAHLVLSESIKFFIFLH